MEAEVDVIQHLLEVENEAALVIKDAQNKADSIISEARAKAEVLFKEKYSECAERIAARENEEKIQINENHEKEIAEYIEKLKSTSKDSLAFEKYLESQLF